MFSELLSALERLDKWEIVPLFFFTSKLVSDLLFMTLRVKTGHHYDSDGPGYTITT